MKKSKQNTNYKKYIIPLLKLSLVSGLLYYLVRKGFISLQATQEALQQWEKILPAIIAIFLTLPLGVYRWQWLLRAQNIHLRWTKALQLTMIGNFFNIALPGAVSGDFVKAFYVGKEIRGEKTRAFGSILFDRVAGVSALVVVSAVALAFGLSSFLHSPLMRGIQALMGTAALSVLLFYGYLFMVRERHDPLLRGLRRIEKKFKPVEAITRVYSSLRHYHNHRSTVLKVLAVSAIIHLTVGWSCLRFASALGDTHLSLLSLYVVVPLGLLVTAIPIAPGGVGTGNVAFLYLFHLIGSERGADVFSLFAVTQIAFGCLGGLVYFRFRAGKPLPNMPRS